MSEMTVDELLALFGRAPVENRRVSSADSEEYLAMVTYLVDRSNPR
jgi:hypothetical protein